MVPPRPTISRKPQGFPIPCAAGSSAAGDPAGAESPAPGPKGPGPARAEAWVQVARLIRPHGRRGELVAEILTDFPERFHQRPRLFLIPPERIASRPRAIQMENFWFLRSRIVMKFAGIDSINEAEALRGFSVAIPVAERAPLDTGSVYVSELIGYRVIDLNRESADVGAIVDVDRTSSSTELLVVRRDRESGELLIPFVAAYVVHMDTAQRRLEMRLPDGLLQINAPMTGEEKQAAKNR